MIPRAGAAAPPTLCGRRGQRGFEARVPGIDRIAFLDRVVRAANEETRIHLAPGIGEQKRYPLRIAFGNRRGNIELRFLAFAFGCLIRHWLIG